MLDWLNVDAILFDVCTKADLLRLNLSAAERRYVSLLDKKSSGLGKLALVHTKRNIFMHALSLETERLLFFEDDVRIEAASPLSIVEQIVHLWHSLPPRWNYLNLGRCLSYCNKQRSLGSGLVQDLINLCTHSIVLDRTAMSSLLQVFANYLLPMGDDLLLAHLTSRGALINIASDRPVFDQDRLHITSTLHLNGSPEAHLAPDTCANLPLQQIFARNYHLLHEHFELADPTATRQTVPSLENIFRPLMSEDIVW
ncbi:uncharacterized protein MONBRDRAFT_37034 [Monosiga brevicollis MX1]|uniref:Uncharacterized protein n=1 Tax=Monosiga brevicollis TaxID=81824 RepID=A9UZ64_MONBE|nr:uncharacterized protein MONBRDRAFT_37034 [Monosiga brevicollis MX1]EDQ89179.1 predicted protein [Monosiga brevicollis MX1]|eukprot:XP_001745755.1 hypothetical protein [Monosiga brevicollis MX1]